MKSKKRSHKTQPIDWATAMDLLKRLQGDEMHRERLFFGIGFYTGLLVSDYSQLKWCDLVFSDGTVKKRITFGDATGKHQIINLNEKLQMIIGDSYNGQSLDKYIFTSKRHLFLNAPLTVAGCNYLIDKVLKRYGIKAANYSSHTLRKTFGRRIWEVQGKTDEALFCLAQIFHHPNIATTRQYLGIKDETIMNLYLSI